MKNVRVYTSLSFILFAILHALSQIFDLYDKVHAWDLITHLAGGLFLAYTALFFVKNDRPLMVMALVFIAALGGSFVWELWEYGVYVVAPHFVDQYHAGTWDSLSDMLMGALGGSLAGLHYFFASKKEN